MEIAEHDLQHSEGDVISGSDQNSRLCSADSMNQQSEESAEKSLDNLAALEENTLCEAQDTSTESTPTVYRPLHTYRKSTEYRPYQKFNVKVLNTPVVTPMLPSNTSTTTTGLEKNQECDDADLQKNSISSSKQEIDAPSVGMKSEVNEVSNELCRKLSNDGGNDEIDIKKQKTDFAEKITVKKMPDIFYNNRRSHWGGIPPNCKCCGPSQNEVPVTSASNSVVSLQHVEKLSAGDSQSDIVLTKKIDVNEKGEAYEYEESISDISKRSDHSKDHSVSNPQSSITNAILERDKTPMHFVKSLLALGDIAPTRNIDTNLNMEHLSHIQQRQFLQQSSGEILFSPSGGPINPRNLQMQPNRPLYSHEVPPYAGMPLAANGTQPISFCSPFNLRGMQPHGDGMPFTARGLQPRPDGMAFDPRGMQQYPNGRFFDPRGMQPHPDHMLLDPRGMPQPQHGRLPNPRSVQFDSFGRPFSLNVRQPELDLVAPHDMLRYQLSQIRQIGPTDPHTPRFPPWPLRDGIRFHDGRPVHTDFGFAGMHPDFHNELPRFLRPVGGSQFDPDSQPLHPYFQRPALDPRMEFCGYSHDSIHRLAVPQEFMPPNGFQHQGIPSMDFPEFGMPSESEMQTMSGAAQKQWYDWYQSYAAWYKQYTETMAVQSKMPQSTATSSTATLTVMTSTTASKPQLKIDPSAILMKAPVLNKSKSAKGGANATTTINSPTFKPSTAVVSSGEKTVAAPPSKFTGEPIFTNIPATKEEDDEDDPSERQLWVGNLPLGTKAVEARDLLNKYGSVLNCKVGAMKSQTESGLFALITMETVADAMNCIKFLHDTDFNGNTLIVRKL